MEVDNEKEALILERKLRLVDLVSSPTEYNMDVLAEAFFKSTAFGKVMDWSDFKKRGVVQANFFFAGVYRVLIELCKMSKVEFDSSQLKKDIINKYMGQEDKDVVVGEVGIKSEPHGKITNID